MKIVCKCEICENIVDLVYKDARQYCYKRKADNSKGEVYNMVFFCSYSCMKKYDKITKEHFRDGILRQGYEKCEKGYQL
jgi:hypothetical protein